MVALGVFTVIMLGILASIIVVGDTVQRNNLRNTAVKIAQRYAEDLRGIPFSQVVSKEVEESYPVGNSTVPFKVSIQVLEEIPNSLKTVGITVSWFYKGKEYKYRIETVITDD
ncbi:MAG: hypothetical protein GXO45_04855 [Aquificae bacterium]|nr:hypothetical protein [Aquificota bacterium]